MRVVMGAQGAVGSRARALGTAWVGREGEKESFL